MTNIETINNHELKMQSLRIVSIENPDTGYFLTLENNQKILITKMGTFDLSEYNHFHEVFTMESRKCAVLTKNHSLYVIDLDTKEVIFNDKDAYLVSKNDEQTLRVCLQSKNVSLFDIERKKYIPTPKDYKFDYSLNNNIYVFAEKNKDFKAYHELKKFIINIDGKTILKDIKGHIELVDNYLIIS